MNEEHKKTDPFRSRFLLGALSKDNLRGPLCPEAFATEDRLAPLFHWTWFEGNLAGSATLRANGVVQLPRSIVALCATSVSAILATLWGTKALRCVELLFAFREGKLRSAIAALDLLISHKTERRKK